MAEGPLIDRLDQTVDAIVFRRDATFALADAELAPLARLAAELRHAPATGFASRLRAHLQRRSMMSTALAANTREGFTTVTPYLRAPDAGLSQFLTEVFGAETINANPAGHGSVHREMRVGDSMIMIGEAPPDAMPPARGAFHVYVPDVDAAFARALAAGGTSLGGPIDHDYGERAGYIRDAYGNHWFIARPRGSSSYVPAGLRTLTPFLHAPNAVKYIDFLKQALSAVEEARHESEGVLRHALLRIGSGAIELGEAEAGTAPFTATFYLYVGDADLLYHQAIAAGASSLSAPADQWYGDRVASVQDPIGNRWYIARPA